MPCCIGLSKKACFQHNLHGYIDRLPIGDGVPCEGGVPQSSVNLVDECFDAVVEVPVRFHLRPVFMLIRFVGGPVSLEKPLEYMTKICIWILL